MKKALLSKRTGDIGYLYTNKDVNYQVLDENDCVLCVYDTLSRLIEEWKDMPEEPKEYWYINCYGEVLHAFYNGNEWDERRKLIGNYFETIEEAEKAVEKFKAWKRLKDKGFRFGGYELVDGTIRFMIDLRPLTPDDLYPDLDLLFGGKE